MKTKTIDGPTRNPSDHAYQAECQSTLLPSFSLLTDEAVKSGWPRRQVLYALMVMAARELAEIKE